MYVSIATDNVLFCFFISNFIFKKKFKPQVQKKQININVEIPLDFRLIFILKYEPKSTNDNKITMYNNRNQKTNTTLIWTKN